jgi:hypothetical protein
MIASFDATLEIAAKTADSGLATRTQLVQEMTSTPIQIPVSTFDLARAVTRTPSPPAQCPVDDPDMLTSNPPMKALMVDTDVFDEKLLEYINAGGMHALIENAKTAIGEEKIIFNLQSIDVTGDGIPETIFNHGSGMAPLYILGCDQNKYRIFGKINQLWAAPPNIISHRDMNLDGIPELLVLADSCNSCETYSIFEWDGQNMQSMLRDWKINSDTSKLDFCTTISLGRNTNAGLEDIDHNGTYEFIVTGGLSYTSDDINMGPFRGKILTYMWDGQYFSLKSTGYSQAEYRFQAVQDADEAFGQENYEKALSLYQDAAFSDRLKSWSEEIRQQELLRFYGMWETTPTVTPLPPNPTESSQLASYALYRISLLHLVQGHSSDAQTVYQSLVKEYPFGSAGHPYVEMATVFWNAYQAKTSIGEACAHAVQYATDHPELLIPLSGGGWGSQWARRYQPVDVCPITK